MHITQQLHTCTCQADAQAHHHAYVFAHHRCKSEPILLLLQALCTDTGSSHPQLSHLTNAVVNINVPAQDPFQGFYLAHQGSGIVDLNFQQVTPDAPDEREGHMMEAVGNEQEATTPKNGKQPGRIRTFRNFAGAMRWYAFCLFMHVADLYVCTG